ncbi:MAG: DNA polymerase III subunit beta [Kiritimatiellae bacterium]|nr:DNA polymerase III subunit beta [Kiritimatiellia bacterium]
MKLKIDRNNLVEALQKVQSVISPRTTLPVLSNVLLKAEGDMLWLSATDLEVSVRTGIKAEVGRQGGTTLPARRIFSIFRELSNPEVEIEVNDKDQATIQCGSSFFKLVGISEDDFPPLPKFDDGARTYTLDQGVFREMLVKTAYAASADETRYVLNGVLLSFKGDKLTVVATDGRRLALVEQEIEFPKGSEGEIIVPSKTVNELTRTLGTEGSLKIQASENQVAFEFGEMLVISKLIDGTYPNFRQVIPSQSEERIPVEREAFLTAVKRVALLTSDQSNSVKLKFGKNRLEITTETPDVGEARETLPVKYAGKEISVAFNPVYLLDPLRTLTSEEIFLEVTDELSPGVLKADVPFLYVLMPVRVS